MQDTDWERIDKTKFFINGIGLFSGVTTLLFPLSVLKTRQMSSHGVSGGFEGTKQTARVIWRTEGVPGFYRGFGTVVCGTIPARTIYLTSLEVVKDGVAKLGRKVELSEPLVATTSNFAGGACASLSTQLVTVPIDVVSQRQMVHGTDTHSKEWAGSTRAQAASTAPRTDGPSDAGSRQQGTRQFITQARPLSQHQQHGVLSSSAARSMSHAAAGPSSSIAEAVARSRQRQGQAGSTGGAAVWSAPGHSTARWLSSGGSGAGAGSGEGALPARPGGLQVARLIIREEGVRGLYRGFLPSVATFVPSSALWWGAYGGYQQVLSALYVQVMGTGVNVGAYVHGTSSMSTGEVMAVQTVASMFAGATSSLLTNPLDLIKTRIQIARKAEGQPATFRAVLEEILREDGAVGLLRGALPRMANASLWGTCMVTVYEFLKRISLKEDTHAV